MFAHEHEILLPAALAQKGCKVNHFFIPAKILSKFFFQIKHPDPLLSLINSFESRLSLKAGAKIETFYKTAKQKEKKYLRKFLICSFQESSK
jgi:hypothetical protein